jgi:hypothetical protein
VTWRQGFQDLNNEINRQHGRRLLKKLWRKHKGVKMESMPIPPHEVFGELSPAGVTSNMPPLALGRAWMER